MFRATAHRLHGGPHVTVARGEILVDKAMRTSVPNVWAIGDLIGGALSLYIIIEAWRLGVPRGLLARMGWNVAIDTLVGEIPLLGDLFDIAFKANIRNLALLDGFAQRPVEVRRTSRRFVALLVAGLVLLTAGAIALAVVLVRLLSGLFQ